MPSLSPVHQTPDYFLPEHYLPESLLRRGGAGRAAEELAGHHGALCGMGRGQAKTRFIQHLQESPLYGLHCYQVYQVSLSYTIYY